MTDPTNTESTADALPVIPGYVFVRMPDGSIVPVPESAIVNASDAPATVKQDGPGAVPVEPEPEAQYYVHLANGEILRVTESDLPKSGGTNSPYGHWQKGNSVHVVIGIYPVETLV